MRHLTLKPSEASVARRIDAKGFVSRIAFAGILALVISACDEPVSEQVAKLDVLDVMITLAPEETPPPNVRTIRREGTMNLCTTGESFEVRVVRGGQDEGGTCVAFPVEYVHREGSFPYVDVVIDGTAYSANEVHLVRRSRAWFLFIEGNHDESVTHEHQGVVFHIIRDTRTNEIELVLKCSGHIEASDEQDLELYQCINERVQSLDIALVSWTSDDSCVIDYSACSSVSTELSSTL